MVGNIIQRTLDVYRVILSSAAPLVHVAKPIAAAICRKFGANCQRRQRVGASRIYAFRVILESASRYAGRHGSLINTLYKKS